MGRLRSVFPRTNYVNLSYFFNHSLTHSFTLWHAIQRSSP